MCVESRTLDDAPPQRSKKRPTRCHALFHAGRLVMNVRTHLITCATIADLAQDRNVVGNADHDGDGRADLLCSGTIRMRGRSTSG